MKNIRMNKAIVSAACVFLIAGQLSCFDGALRSKRGGLLSFLFLGTLVTSEPSAPPALSPPVTSLKGWELNAGNTGVAGAGIDRTTLPQYEPPAGQVAYGTWTVPAGTTVSNQYIETGGIDISAGGITFEYCWLRPTSIGRGMPFFRGGGTSPAIIRNCDIDGSAIALNADGTNPACGSIAVSCANTRVLLCNISGFGSGVAFYGGDPVTLECTYIHDLVQGEWVLGSGQSHQDGCTLRDYTGTLALIRSNYILTNPVSHLATGPVFLQATWDFCFLDNIYIVGNLLAGYGYSLAVERDNGGYGCHLWAVDNRFDSYSGWLAYVEHGPGWALWQDNFLNDAGQADNRGTAVAEPLPQTAVNLIAPGNLRATAASATAIGLAWSDRSRSETGYKIMRSSDGTTFTSITITGKNAVSYTDTGLAAGTAYFYRIAAVNRNDMSAFSGTAGATTPAGP